MREWYVIRLDRPQDTSKPHVTVGRQEGAEALPRPRWNADLDLLQAVQPAPRAGGRQQVRPRDVDQAEQQPQVQVADPGFGFFVKPGDRDDKSGTIVFTTAEAAEGYAKEQASLHPKVLYGVFSCDKVFETTEPQIVVKSYNDGGELVIQQQGEQNV